MQFKRWLNLVEAFDNPKLKDILLKNPQIQDKEELNKFVKELEDSPTVYNKPQAFTALKQRFDIVSNTAAPTDTFLKQYFDKRNDKQISSDEYKTLEYFFKPNANKDLLTEMMTKLRELIVQDKIKLIFTDKPRIKFKNTTYDNYTDLITFLSIIHGIEGEGEKPTEEAGLQNPAFLELSHKADLKAKINNIWVFKGDDPVKCRIMGKGQTWCISSSTSVTHYFGYRHNYGQTQYFIFDFNKDVNNPARYVNPGVAPKGRYSEWVDRKNQHSKDKDGVAFGINGYSSLQEYLVYLRSKGIDTDIFVADIITKDEETLKDYVDNNDFEGAKGHSEIMFNYYLKLVREVTDKQFNSLTVDQRQEFLLGKVNISVVQVAYLSNLGIKFFKEYINSIDNINFLLEYVDDKDAMAKIILQYKKELNDDNIKNLLSYAKDKDAIANLILHNKKELLTDNNVFNLLQYAKDKDEMAILIINNKKELLSDKNVYHLLNNANNKDKIANILGSENINKLSDNNVSYLLQNAKDKDEMANIIINNINKLTDDNVSNLLYSANNKDEMAKIIIKYKKELTDKNVENLLQYATDKDEIAKIIINNRKDLLIGKNVYNLLYYAKDKDEMAILIINNKKELTAGNVYSLLYYAKNKDAIANILGLENINKLSNDNIDNLLYYAENKDEMANIIIKYKKELTDDNVSNLLYSAKDKNKMVKILGSENKLTDDNVFSLLKNAYNYNKDAMAKILGSENINKLSDGNIKDLLYAAESKYEMAKILGSENINKLTDDNVYSLLYYAENKDEMVNILGSENINKLSDDNIDNLLYAGYEITKGEISQERLIKIK